MHVEDTFYCSQPTLSVLQGNMEWPEDFPEDHAFVELLVPGVSSDLDFEQFMKDTEEKLNQNARRLVWKENDAPAMLTQCLSSLLNRVING